MRGPPSSDHKNALPKTKKELYYGGGWHPAVSGEVADVRNPANGQHLGGVAWARAEDADRAVRAACDGFTKWRRTMPPERAVLLRRAADIIRTHGREIATLDAADTGVPYAKIAADVDGGALAFDFFAGLVTELKGSTIPVGEGKVNYTVREPLGVVVRINAYNHPFLFACQHVSASLAAGNSVIAKPPEQAPLSTLYLAELIGSLFPAGAFNVLPGGRACGEALVSHPNVAKVGLVGSVPTGRAILKSAADTFKKVSLELGGKNALIAYPDANLENLVPGIIKGMNFAFLGQSCGSTSRVFLHASIHDVVLTRAVEIVRRMKFGDPIDPATEMGCLISQAQLDKVMNYVELVRRECALLVFCGASTTE